MGKKGSATPPAFTLTTSINAAREKQLEARQQNKFTDFVIKVENEQIACHKLILSSHSEYFNRMLNHEKTAEVVEGSVTLKELDPDAVLRVTEFFYSGKINVDFDLVQKVMEVVNYFQVSDDILAEKLTKYIVNNLQAESALGWYFTADQLNVPKVKEKASDILVQKCRYIDTCPEFLNLECKQFMDYLRLLLQKKAVPCDQILDVAVKWAMDDVDSRKDTFEEAIKQIDLSKCSPNVLMAVYKKHGKVLITSGDIQQQFTIAALSLVTDKASEVLVIGGYLQGAEVKCNKKTWMLNLKTGAYIPKASYPKCQYFAEICKTPKGVMCVGGFKQSNCGDVTARCFQYDIEKDVWSQIPPLPAPTSCAGAVCVDDVSLVVLGGEDNSKKVYCFDMNRRKWNCLPDMLQGMRWPIVGYVNKCIFVVFYRCPENEVEQRGSEISLQCFDTITQRWSFKAPLPDSVKSTSDAYSQAVTLGGSLYVTGTEEKICLKYDTDQDKWTVLAQSLEVHCLGALVMLNNKILLCGGVDKDGAATDIIEEYDPSTNTWRLLPVKLPKPLFQHTIIPV